MSHKINLKVIVIGGILTGLLTSCSLPQGASRDLAVRSSPQQTYGEGDITEGSATATNPPKSTWSIKYALSQLFKHRKISRKRYLSDRTNVPGITSKRLLVRTTAYSHNEKDHLIYRKKNAIGTTLQYGNTVRSAAADWSKFPLGTEFAIAGEPGVKYVIDDYGSALVGTETIDLYKPSIRSMNHWGVRHVDIEILKWGSIQESLRVMLPRTKFAHVRKMVQSLMGKGDKAA